MTVHIKVDPGNCDAKQGHDWRERQVQLLGAELCEATKEKRAKKQGYLKLIVLNLSLFQLVWIKFHQLIFMPEFTQASLVVTASVDLLLLPIIRKSRCYLVETSYKCHVHQFIFKFEFKLKYPKEYLTCDFTDVGERYSSQRCV